MTRTELALCALHAACDERGLELRLERARGCWPILALEVSSDLPVVGKTFLFAGLLEHPWEENLRAIERTVRQLPVGRLAASGGTL